MRRYSEDAPDLKQLKIPKLQILGVGIGRAKLMRLEAVGKDRGDAVVRAAPMDTLPCLA